MTTQSQRDALALLVLMTYDKVFDYWVSRAPRESKSGGSGVGDTIPRRGSTDEVHATQVSKAQDPKKCKKREGHVPNDALGSARRRRAPGTGGSMCTRTRIGTAAWARLPDRSP